MASQKKARVEVHKFGGASLADGPALAHAVEIVAGRRPARMAVVVSAMAGVTDALLLASTQAASGDETALRKAADTLQATYAAAAALVPSSGETRRKLQAAIAARFDELRSLGHGLALVRELSPRTRDLIASRGEWLSGLIMTDALAARGLDSVLVDPLQIIVTDGAYGNASPDLAATDAAVRRVIRPLLAAGKVPVVPGFFGAAPDGSVATMGRGGTDVTALLLGRALGATEVSLWKDVPGLLTADPRVVPNARIIPQLNVREAAELAYHGARVLHPRALIPVLGRDVPLRVRPFATPLSAGTEISARRTLARHPVKGISAVPGQALVTVAGNGMLGVPGIAARTFGALYHAGISVSLISQASSEHSICFTVPAATAEAARRSLRAAFAEEIARRDIDRVEVRTGVATLAVVGLGMAGTPGIATRVFGALSASGINVVAIAQGSSELNISVVLDAADVAAAQRSVHAAFQLDKIGGGAASAGTRADLVLLGFGQIARSLCRLLQRRAKSKRPELRVVAVVDRGGFMFDRKGLTPRRLAKIAEAKRENGGLKSVEGGRAATAAEALRQVAGHALARPILVDLTAADTTPVLMQALTSGLDVVLANKKPLSGPREGAAELLSLAERHGKRLLHETTVGAGLPIIDTYYKLVESGDRVKKIQGSLSGTLGYLLTGVGRGRRFSEALLGAMAKGYTEPDPRDDLSGTDVARKAIILARLMGYRGELEDVVLKPMLPEEARVLPLAEFLARLSEWDEEWARRVERARERGLLLRHLCTVTAKRVTVGLEAVEAAGPFASLEGTDNQLVFTTRRYPAGNPLIIKGPGAGPAVTAAGVLNDILSVAGR